MTSSIKNIALISFAIFLTAMAFVLFQSSQQVQGSTFTANAISAATTSTAIAVTTSTRILATTTNVFDPANSYTRIYADICNPSAKTVFISMNQDKGADARTRGGHWIAAGQCYQITDANQYSGSVTASTSDQSSVSLNVIDYVQ